MTSSPCWWTSGVATLSSVRGFLHVLHHAIRTHVKVVVVPAVDNHSISKKLVRHHVLIRPSSTYMSVTCCLRPTYEVLMAKKSSRVSHTSSRMVRTWCLRSPSAGLRPPPQLTSNCAQKWLENWRAQLWAELKIANNWKTHFYELVRVAKNNIYS